MYMCVPLYADMGEKNREGGGRAWERKIEKGGGVGMGGWIGGGQRVSCRGGGGLGGMKRM